MPLRPATTILPSACKAIEKYVEKNLLKRQQVHIHADSFYTLNRTTIRRLKEEGITLLLVEQFAKSALEVADYAYVMEHGRIAVEGTPDELSRNERVIAAYLG